MINLKIYFKNITKYDKKVYKQFLKFHQKIFGLKYTIYTVFIIGLLIFLIAIQIKVHNMNLAIATFFVIIGFFIWRYLYPTYKVNKEFNSEKIQNKKEFTFIFYKNFLKIYENNKCENYILKYNKIYKIFETNNFFYIYIDKTHSLLINKNTFIIGNSKDFSEFIQKRCKLKFKKI